jgi:hypothetical protein
MFSFRKDITYNFDDKNLFTTLTENEILASRKDDPFSTSINIYSFYKIQSGFLSETKVKNEPNYVKLLWRSSVSKH